MVIDVGLAVFVGFLILGAVVSLATAFITRKPVLCFISAFLWAILSLVLWVSSEAEWDAYYAAGFVGFFVTVGAALSAGVLWERNPKDIPVEGDDDNDEPGGLKKRKRSKLRIPRHL